MQADPRVTIHDLISGRDFTSDQRNELFIAYDENPQGLERIAKRSLGANNPDAALIAMVRKGQHLKAEGAAARPDKPPADTLEDVVQIALSSYNARTAKYPPIEERGWTQDDAIVYAVDVAATWNTRLDVNDIERGLRKILGCAWDSEGDPALGTGCPPDLLAEILANLGRVGTMPEPTPPAVDDLAARLLATLGKAA